MRISTISPREIKNGNGVILDVRTPMECAEKSLCCKHIRVPLDKLSPSEFAAQNGLASDACIYILCRSGQRASRAAEKFIEAGMTNIHVIEGGIEGCESCGEELQGSAVRSASGIRGNSPITLERQVRIAAGLFALTGALLGYFLHPLFMLVPAFVGAGLIFAGITNRCGLALILTRMPWNRI